MGIFSDLQIDIPPEELNFFLNHAKLETFKKGAYFHEAHKACNKIGLVQSGLFKSYVLDEKLNEKIIEFYPEQSFVSAYTSFISQKATDWNIQALEDSEAYRISKDLLETLYKRHSCWVNFGLKIFEAQTLKKCNREKSLLVNNALERYQIFQQQYQHIEHRLPLNQIAMYLGIQPESFSRIRKEMAT